MGTCYKLFLEDEFDWGYMDTTKDERLKEFEKAYGGCCERVVEWYGFVVYDIDKQYPYTKERKDIIAEFCDRAYYTTDSGTGITELELPRPKLSVVEYFNDINNRRTHEEKKASEAIITERLKQMVDLP